MSKIYSSNDKALTIIEAFEMLKSFDVNENRHTRTILNPKGSDIYMFYCDEISKSGIN